MIKGKKQGGQTMLAVVIILLIMPLSTLLGQIDEYTVKSLFLGRVARFVEWPKDAEMGNPEKPFIIGIFGENPFGAKLEDYYLRKLKPRKIKNKPVKILYIKRIEEIPGCHLLFIADLPKRLLAKIIEYTRDKPILTVGDTNGYARRGVHINLVIKKAPVDKTRAKVPTIDMEINETALRQAGLLADKQLMELPHTEVVSPYSPYEDKAHLLGPITRFITWPTNSGMEDPSEPFIIEIIGHNFFGKHLDRIYKKKKLKDKLVNVRYISTVKEIDTPHLLFISKSLKNSISEIIAFTKGKPILTVGDTNGFAKKGVHINFIYERLRLRFDVNEKAARAAGFNISYHLLKMARANIAL